MDVPVARYVSTICQLGGITVPFTDLQLQSLYGTHAAYYALMEQRTDQAVADGWLLPEDAIDLMRRACEASVRFQLTPAQCEPYVPPPFDQPLAVTAASGPSGPTAAAAPPAAMPAAPAEQARGGVLARTGGTTVVLGPLALLALGVLARRATVRA
jgi:hypothetical protein